MFQGGVQRRRTYEDQLQMRTFFQEDDLISAEVKWLCFEVVLISTDTKNIIGWRNFVAHSQF